MIHKDAKTIKPNGLINRLKMKGSRGKKDGCTCNKTKLASNRSTSRVATKYFKFLFCSQTKPILFYIILYYSTMLEFRAPLGVFPSATYLFVSSFWFDKVSLKK